MWGLSRVAVPYWLGLVLASLEQGNIENWPSFVFAFACRFDIAIKCAGLPFRPHFDLKVLVVHFSFTGPYPSSQKEKLFPRCPCVYF